MAMTETEIENLAQEMIDHSVAQQVAAEIIKEAKRARGRAKCPHCGGYATKKHPDAKEAQVCKDCSTMWADGFQFVFPKWARGRKAHLRRVFCLTFNVKGA